MREITIREALQEALREEMRRDSTVFVLGEDIAQFGGAYIITQGLLDEFGPERVRNTPLVEAAIAGAALGAALVGMRPIAEIMYIDFTPIAMEQIFNQIAKIRYMTGGMVKVPLVIRMPAGGGISAGPHHSQTWEALYAHVPGLKVVMPSTAYDAKGLLKSSIRDDNPVIFIETKKLYGQKGMVPEEEYLVPLGKAEVRREGSDITIIAIARMINLALRVAEVLEKEGVSVEVVDPRTLIPFDENTVMNSVKKTGRALIVHEACRTGGFGAEIAARIADEAFDYLNARIKRVGTLDCPIPFNPKLEDYVIPNEHDIWAAALEVMGIEFKEYPGERVADIAAR